MCSRTSDCLDIINDGIARQCYFTSEFSNRTNFCDCSNWYGFKGEQCDDDNSFQVQYLRITTIIILIWSSILILFYSKVLFKASKYIKNNKNIRVVFSISLLFNISTICFLMTSALQLPSLLNSK